MVETNITALHLLINNSFSEKSQQLKSFNEELHNYAVVQEVIRQIQSGWLFITVFLLCMKQQNSVSRKYTSDGDQIQNFTDKIDQLVPETAYGIFERMIFTNHHFFKPEQPVSRFVFNHSFCF